MNSRLLGALCAIIAITCFPGTASSYSLSGDQVDGVLNSGFGHTLLSQFSPTTNVTVTDPDSEFTGELRANLWDGVQYNVIVNLFADYLTVSIQETTSWGATGGIGIGGDTATLFDISLSGLDGGEAISSVTYNEALSFDVVADFNDTRYINWTDSTIDIGFRWARDEGVYHFDINQSVVPIPAAAWLFGTGLLGLVGFARKKT